MTQETEVVVHDFTEEVVAPLDAYITTKPGEPPFTLQGGDPLAAPLVRIWALAARCRAGIISVEKFLTKDTLNELTNACIRHSVSGDEREKQNLLVRATAAEEVSWAMDAYRKGDYATEKPTEAASHLPELQRIELHDLRVRCAQKLSGFCSELEEMREALTKAGYGADIFDDMLRAANLLHDLSEQIEPRRLFKR